MPNLYSQVRIPLTAATLFVTTTSNAKVAFLVLLFLFVSTTANRAQNLYVIERDDVYGFRLNSNKGTKSDMGKVLIP
jgi:hypothetical protein